MHALAQNVATNNFTGFSTAVFKEFAAPLLDVQAAVLQDPKVGGSSVWCFAIVVPLRVVGVYCLNLDLKKTNAVL